MEIKPNTIPVVASFDGKGNLLPLYVRINGESYKIENCSLKCDKQQTLVYTCQTIDHGIMKQFFLCYSKENCTWTWTEKIPYFCLQ